MKTLNKRKAAILLLCSLTIATLLDSIVIYGQTSSTIRNETSSSTCMHALKCEFHLHTTYSDGAYSPAEMIQYYKEHGYDVVAVTDHTNIEGWHDGIAEAQAAGASAGVLVIEGGEISFRWEDNTHKHILALFCHALDSTNEPTDLSLEEIFHDIHAKGGLGIVAHPWRGWSNWQQYQYADYIDGWEYEPHAISPEYRLWLLNSDKIYMFNHDAHGYWLEGSEWAEAHTLLLSHNRTLSGVREALESRRIVVSYGSNYYGSSEALAIYQDYLGCAHADNQAPEMNPISGPDTVYRGDIVEFHVAGHDPDGDYPLSYEWTINGYLMEGATGPTLTFLHTMESWSVGENVVAVRVTDSRGASTEVNKTYTTLNHPPTISGISGDINGYRGTYTWEATGSDAEDDDLTYMWYVDGEKKSESEDGSFTYTFDSGDSICSHTIRVRVKDEIGDYSDYSTLHFDLQEQPPEYYDLTVAVTGFGSTSPSAGVHSYEEGTEVDVSASARSGWTFSHWLLDSANVGDANPYPVTMDGDNSLTAVFTEIPPEEYDLTLAVTGSGSTSPSIGIHTYTDGTNVSVTATPSAGWTFSHWLLDSVNVGSNSPYIVTMNSNHSLVAVFTEIPPDNGDEPSFEETTIHVYFGQDVYAVKIRSNSTVSDFDFAQALKKIQFNVNGTSGTTGFCNFTIPSELMSGNFSIYKDDILLTENVDYIETYNGTHYLFNITYKHSTHTIEIVATNIIPEFPSFLVLPLFIIATLLGAIYVKKRKRCLK